MRHRLEQITAMAAASAGTLLLGSCSTTDEPETFTATVTVTGAADRASAESAECTVEGAHVAANDRVVIIGDGFPAASAPAVAASMLKVDSIDQYPDGSGVCTYTAHFDDVPANQRGYDIWIHNFTQQRFTADELKNGVTFSLHSAIDNAPQ